MKVEEHKSYELIGDPVEYLKADLLIQQPGADLLRKCMSLVSEDATTYDILKAYLLDEEEDLYWSDGQAELIDRIGVQNWLVQHL